MAFRIDPGREMSAEVPRIALEEIDKAIAELERAESDRTAAIHECRKHCKKVRGLMRLVRPALGGAYRPANRIVRDAARAVSPLRDAEALLHTFDDLIAAHRQQLPDEGLGSVRDRLRADAHDAAGRTERASEMLEESAELLRGGRAQIANWTLDDEGFETLAGGLTTTYRRGRKACEEAIAAPTPTTLHEYRKQVKYTWYHLRLLRSTAPSLIKPLEARWHDLADILGDDHDLAVLGARITANPEHFGDEDETTAAMLLIDGERTDLQRRALPLAARLHAETPGAFTKRIRCYWHAWHDVGPEINAATLITVHPPSDGLAEQPRSELHKRARNLAIAGRSTMNKTDLIGALRASGPHPAAT